MPVTPVVHVQGSETFARLLCHFGSMAPVSDCLSCRVTGTLVCLTCSGYLTSQLYTRPPVRGIHRLMTVTFATGFAALGVARAVI